jgi:hypothetical protein
MRKYTIGHLKVLNSMGLRPLSAQLVEEIDGWSIVIDWPGGDGGQAGSRDFQTLRTDLGKPRLFRTADVAIRTVMNRVQVLEVRQG